jgi:TIR domain
MPAVFLSYAHAQRETADALVEGLNSQAIEVWRDKTDLRAGERWPSALAEAIRNSNALLLLWSAAALQSEFVDFEWNTALALKKPILIVLHDETALPAALCALHGIAERRLEETPQSKNAVNRRQLRTRGHDVPCRGPHPDQAPLLTMIHMSAQVGVLE